MRSINGYSSLHPGPLPMWEASHAVPPLPRAGEGAGGEGSMPPEPAPVLRQPAVRHRQQRLGDCHVRSEPLAGVRWMPTQYAERPVADPQSQIEHQQRPEQHLLQRAVVLPK